MVCKVSTGHSICFKHLKRNCLCKSPKKISMHHSFRCPPDGNLNDWKETVKWMMSLRNEYLKTQLKDVTKGTRLETYYNNLNK